MNGLELSSCSFNYNKTNILNDINIIIPSHSITAVVGMNGSGKSTFLKCVAGILSWNKGTCLFEGKRTKNLWNIIGYVPQMKKIPFNYKVAEFISFGDKNNQKMLTTNTKKKNLMNTISEILEQLEIEDIMDKYCGEISGGQMQMVYLGYALISKPRILLLDEPELNLDLYRQEQLNNILKKLAKEGTTIIINSHFIGTVINLANNCLMLKKNNYKYGNMEDVLNEKTIKEYLSVDSVIKNIEIQPNIEKKVFVTY